MDLPSDISEALRAEDFIAVQQWWRSLSALQRKECCRISVDHVSSEELLCDDEPEDEGDETEAIYDYLINHELRIVGFIDTSSQSSNYRIKTSYVASLGEDYRHGDSGTVG